MVPLTACMTSSWPDLTQFPAAPVSAGAAEVQPPAHAQPFVHDDGNTRSLHFTMGELQSRMLMHSPWRLEVDYTLTMMGFLLFRPAPLHIAMVGLGGGSLAKFCHRQLPRSQMTVLEINPQVVALRREFQVPDDDERFRVITADGAAYLQAGAARFDVLLIDGFDHQGQPPALCSQRFYDDCFSALSPGGVLVVNLHYDDPDYALLVGRIARSFEGNSAEIVASEQTNSIVFASRGKPFSARGLSVAQALSGLADDEGRAQLRAEFGRITWHMKDTGADRA